MTFTETKPRYPYRKAWQSPEGYRITHNTTVGYMVSFEYWHVE